MQQQDSARRAFIKSSAMGIGALALAPVQATADQTMSSQNEKKLRVLCLGAHPGDPEFGCGGTMAKYSDAGHSVTFLYLTRGEASDPAKTYAEMAALRTEEAAISCKILNAKPLVAGQIDGNTVLDKEKSEAMTKIIAAEKPDLLFTQWPVDGHPDHQVTGLLALTAWVRLERPFHLYFYEVNTGSETMAFKPTDYVDISEQQERKKQAMFAHKTQDPVATYENYFKPLETFRGLEAGAKAAEAFIHFKAKSTRAGVIGL